MSEESLHRHATTVLDSTLRPVIDMKDLSSVTFKIVSHVYTPIDFFTNFLKHVAAAPNPNTSDNEALQKLVFPETVHQPRRETPVQPVRTAVVSPPVPPGLSAFEEEKQTPFIVANFEAADPISKVSCPSFEIQFTSLSTLKFSILHMKVLGDVEEEWNGHSFSYHVPRRSAGGHLRCSASARLAPSW